MEKFLKKKIPLFFYHFFPPFSPRCYYYTCGGSRARAKRTPILQVFLLGTPNNNNAAFLLRNEKRRNKRRRRQRRRRRQNKWWAKRRRRRRCPQRHHHLRAKKEKEKEVDIIIIIVANIWSARYRTRKRSRESCLGSNCRRRNAIMRVVVEEGRK